jgi:hypothetical protein
LADRIGAGLRIGRATERAYPDEDHGDADIPDCH